MIRAVIAGACAIGLALGLAVPDEAAAAQNRPAAVRKAPARSAAKAPRKKAAAAKAAPARKAKASASPRRRAVGAKAAQAQKVRQRMRSRSRAAAVSAKADRRGRKARAVGWRPRVQDDFGSPNVRRRFSVRADGSEAASRGLHQVRDPLFLRSSVALVVPASSHEPLFAKNASERLPIASISKLMTALVVLEMGLPMDEKLTVGEHEMSATHTRLRMGDVLTRRAALHLALMWSDNRAAELLARTAPGGYNSFIARMNAQAKLIGMARTSFEDACGLNRANQATAWDLVKLVNAAQVHPLIREFSTETFSEERVSRRRVPLRTTNRLNTDANWHVVLQKTGFTTPAGRCVAMQVLFAGKPVNIILLDAPASRVRAADAQKIRAWYLAGAPAKGGRRVWDASQN